MNNPSIFIRPRLAVAPFPDMPHASPVMPSGPPYPPRKYGSPRHVHETYGISSSSLYRLLKAGKVRSIRLSTNGSGKASNQGSRLIDLKSLEDHLASCAVK